jgi:hypothetical protein
MLRLPPTYIRLGETEIDEAFKQAERHVATRVSITSAESQVPLDTGQLTDGKQTLNEYRSHDISADLITDLSSLSIVKDNHPRSYNAQESTPERCVISAAADMISSPESSSLNTSR